MKRKNPYVTSYLYLAVTCSIIVSLVFIYLNHDNLKRTNIQYSQKQAEVMIEDWEKQIDQLEQFALRISLDHNFYPVYFSENKYYEYEVVRNLEVYSSYSSLGQECFLYYPEYDENLCFHSSGMSIGMDILLSSLTNEEKEALKSLFKVTGTKMYYLSTTNKIFVVKPIKVTLSSGRSYGILCYILNKKDIRERFLMISGGNGKNVALYMEENLIFSSREDLDFLNQNDVLTASTIDGQFAIYYKPVSVKMPWNMTHSLTVILIIMDIVLIIMLANIFAHRSYRPIEEMSVKYRKDFSFPENIFYENALEEIDYMLDSTIRNNMDITHQIEQKQNLLRKQLLQMLISGYYSEDIQSRLDKMQIKLDGPFYFVMCVSFKSEPNVSDTFLLQLTDDLEENISQYENEYIYALCDPESKQINIILNIKDKNRKNELIDCISEIANTYNFKPIIGTGNVYGSLSKLSASWLESTDNVKRKAIMCNTAKRSEYIYDSNELSPIILQLSGGNKESALEALDFFTNQLENKGESVLMQRYIFADFTGEIIRLAKEYRIELSNQNISLIVSAKNMHSFKEAAQDLICDFCEKILYMKNQTKIETEYKAFEYVNDHFSEYDLSIDKVADTLGISTSAVRQSIYKYTGKMYKDYLISLRIEYAKKLLESEDITIAETCQRVGYTNLSYFTKLFKEMTGITPSKYKKDRYEKN